MKIFENILSNDIAWPPEETAEKETKTKGGGSSSADGSSDADSDDAGVSATARDFISALLRPEVDARLGTRLGAAEVKAHAFFAGVDWDGIQRACERENDDDDATDATRSAEEKERTKRFVPAFVPEPDDELDTSYFAEKPRASAREQPKSARPRQSLGASS